MAEGIDDSVSIPVGEMIEEIDDTVSIRVDEKLRVLLPASAKCNIFKVPNQLRKENDEAYEPQMLAIGPYHRGKDNLKAMEEHKIRYLQLLLQRRSENNVARYVIALRALEERARECYAESLSINRDDFVEMMLLDGCFIVELIRKYTIKELRDKNDPIFKGAWILYSLERDMLLLENQLPFFVLWELFGMTVIPNQQADFTQLIHKYFHDIRPGSRFQLNNQYPIERIKHLLAFIHESWLQLNPEMKSEGTWKLIPCATELKEAGVKFRNVDRENLFDIRFENGIMEIPTISITERTESFFRNLIAYEQSSLDEIPIYVYDYVIVMDSLIHSAKDVELLVRCGILNNVLGDDEVIAKMVNRLCNYVIIYGDFHYSDVFNKLNKHCSKRRNIWKAILRHKYFNSPWALLSVLAAVVLLVLTLAQTIYSLLSYYK